MKYLSRPTFEVRQARGFPTIRKPLLLQTPRIDMSNFIRKYPMVQKLIDLEPLWYIHFFLNFNTSRLLGTNSIHFYIDTYHIDNLNTLFTFRHHFCLCTKNTLINRHQTVSMSIIFLTLMKYGEADSVLIPHSFINNTC